jgi:hypothetical protein
MAIEGVSIVGRWFVDGDRHWHYGWAHPAGAYEAGSDGEDEDACTEPDGAQQDWEAGECSPHTFA